MIMENVGAVVQVPIHRMLLTAVKFYMEFWSWFSLSGFSEECNRPDEASSSNLMGPQPLTMSLKALQILRGPKRPPRTLRAFDNL